MQTTTSVSDWTARVVMVTPHSLISCLYQLIIEDADTGVVLQLPIESPTDARTIAAGLLAQISESYEIDVSPGALGL